MNEQEILRQQVATERRHLAQVRNACEAALAAALEEAVLDGFCQCCAGYLVYIVARFNAQDQMHAQLLGPRLGPADASFRPMLAELEATLASSRSAIARLGKALEARRGGRATASEFILETKTYIDYFNQVLRRRQNTITPLLERLYTIVDWRAACMVTADSILEEREQYGRVELRLPAGIELKSSGRPS